MTLGACTRPTTAQLKKEIKYLKSKKETQIAVRSAIGILLVSAAFSVLLCMLWFPIYKIHHGSMEPTLWDGDIVIFMSIGKVQRGDVVAFHYNNQTLIKRVIAVGGEEIDVSRSGTTTINGEIAQGLYLNKQTLHDNKITFPFFVPDRSFFVVGDNPFLSVDSRMKTIGAVSNDQISGKAVFRVWPLSRIGSV